MATLIDGYNLLHASGVFPPRSIAGTLQAARLALLDSLVERLTPREIAQTTIIFDAADAPPGLPKQLFHNGLLVRFAPSHSDADELIEELIEACPAPRELVVVSSDHRLHRAGRRRKATCVDSEVWFAELNRRQQATSDPITAKPQQAPSEAEVRYWLQAFHDPASDIKLPPPNPYHPFPPDIGDDLRDPDV